MKIKCHDPPERNRGPARLIGVEDWLFVEPEGHARACAIADKDLDREKRRKTSTVHVVRFEFGRLAREAVRAGGRGGQVGLRPCAMPVSCADRARDPGQFGG